MIDIKDNLFLEKIILKSALIDKSYLALMCSTFESSFFDDSFVAETYKVISDHYLQYNKIPDRDIIINMVKQELKTDIISLFEEVDSIDFNVPNNYDFLLSNTNEYLKVQAMKSAILKSVETIRDKEENKKVVDYNIIRKYVEDALCKDLKKDIGLDYFKTLGSRLKNILLHSDMRIPTYYPVLDEYINGGFPPFTLSVLIAKIHGFKCVCKDTLVDIRKNDNEIISLKIGDLYKYISEQTYNYECKEKVEMPKLELFQKKYGSDEGQKRYDKWRENIGKSKSGKPSTIKGISKLELFQKKYGSDEGQKRYDIFIEKQRKSQSVNGRRTLSWYIKKYGLDDGQKKYNIFCDNLKKGCKGINSLEWYIKKYGEERGTEKYREKNKKISDPGRGSLIYFQKRYGLDEGQKRYDIYIEKQKKSHSENGYIEKYGFVDGKRRWKKRLECLKHTTSLKGFINRCGKEEGRKKWKERQEKWQQTLRNKPIKEIERINRAKICKTLTSNGYSKVSQKLFWSLYNEIKTDFNLIYFAELNENKQKDESGYNHEYFLKLGDKILFPDFIIKDNNKIIEFDGDYWHGKIGNKKREYERDTLIRSGGYNILHIKEVDFNDNYSIVMKKCMDFIYG